jgi:hypothetical protein
MPVKDHGTINQTVADLVGAVNGEAGTGVAASALAGADLAVRSVTALSSGLYVPYAAAPAGSIGGISYAPPPSGDVTGATDQAALLTWMQAIDSKGGGIGVLLPTWGTPYYITNITNASSPFVNRIDIWGYGATIKSTLPKNTLVPAIVLFAATTGAIIIRGFTLDYTVAVVVDTDAVNRGVNAEPIVIGGKDNLAHFCKEASAYDITVLNGRNNAIYFQFALRVRCRDNNVYHCLSGAIFVNQCDDVWIMGTKGEDLGDDGIAVFAASTYICTRVFVLHNSIKKTYGSGVNFSGVDNGVIDHNEIDTTWASGIHVWHDIADSFGTCSNIQIGDHNVIKNAGTYFGVGQFRTTVNGSPQGVRLENDINNIFLGQPTIVTPQGAGLYQALTGTGQVIHNPIYPYTLVGTSFKTGGGMTSVVGNPMVANRMYAVPFVVGSLGPVTAISLTIDIQSAGSAGSVVRLGIYSDTGGSPGALILDAGTVVGTGTGPIAATISQALMPGLYWLVAVGQGAPATQPSLYVLNGQHTLIPATGVPHSDTNSIYQNSVTGALPATFATSGYFGGGPVMVVGF